MSFRLISKNFMSSGAKLRNIILLVKNVDVSAHFYQSAIGVTVLGKGENIVQLESGGTSIILKEAGNNAANLCTGYSPVLTFEIQSMDHTITQALSQGAILDGSMKYMAVGKFASIRSPDGHMIGLFEPTAMASPEPLQRTPQSTPDPAQSTAHIITDSNSQSKTES